MSTVIRIQNVSKRYRLGVINRKMLYQEVQSRWARWRGKPDPNQRIHEGKAPTSGDLWALRDVSFEVRSGDVIGVIGHNGSGKSTLLKILSQITAPTTGFVGIKGKVASLLEVGTGFHPELTGRDNVFLNGAILGMTHREVERIFDSIVDFSGIEQFIDTPVKRYSSGMRVRLAFAVAAHLDPDILIIDEVLAVGDQAFQQKCLGKISDVARAGRTVLFVSHNAAAVQNLCTRGVVLDHGRKVFDGTQTEAIQFYANSQSGDHSTDLASRQDRSGSGEVRITALTLGDGSGRTLGTAVAGQPLELRVHFENRSGKPFPHLVATIQVNTLFDVPVFIQQNALTGDTFGRLPACGTLVCHIPRLPLPAALYRVNLTLTTQAQAGQLLDRLIQAVDLPVEGGDFFGSGTMPLAQTGLCLVDAKWRLEADEPAIAALP